MAVCGPKAQIGVVCHDTLIFGQAERVVVPFFLSLLILTMIPPTYAVSPPSMDTPFVDRCTGEFAASAERDMVDMFESDTDRMLATLAFRSAKAFSNVVSREACICFESAYSKATGPSRPLSIDDLWNTFLALEQNDTAKIDVIWEPLQSLPQEEKDQFLVRFDGAADAMTSCTSRRIKAIQDTSVLFGLNLQIGAALSIIP